MTIVWQVYAQSDMTEGRGGMHPIPELVFDDKQEAWDSVNHRGGVMGRFPGKNCYPMGDLHGVTTWQEAKERVGYAIDYDVRPLETAESTTKGTPVNLELTSADLRMASEMFGILDLAAIVEFVESVTITFRGDGGDTITIGYGESGNPAILEIEHWRRPT